MHTSIEPLPLLRHLHEIERSRGRVRGERWGARTLDLDIVCYGDAPDRRAADLAVPHPELPSREFWQREMAQAAAGVSSCGDGPGMSAGEEIASSTSGTPSAPRV